MCDENLRKEWILLLSQAFDRSALLFSYTLWKVLELDVSTTADYCWLTQLPPTYDSRYGSVLSVYLCHHLLTSCFNSLSCACETCLSLFLCAFGTSLSLLWCVFVACSFLFRSRCWNSSQVQLWILVSTMLVLKGGYSGSTFYFHLLSFHMHLLSSS